MAQTTQVQNGHTAVATPYPTCMESVNRISKLPVVESTIQTATNLYGKVKEYNSLTNWTVSAAEGAVQRAVEVGKPVTTPIIQNLEGPMKRIDGVICASLDYVEDKVPAVKMPPNEMYTCTKDYVHNTVSPVVENAKAYAEPAVQTAKDYMEPAVETAKGYIQPAVEKAMNVMEPTIDMAKHYVEPYMQPAMDRVQNIRENVMHRVDAFFHREHNHEGDEIECVVCQKERDHVEKQKQENEQNGKHHTELQEEQHNEYQQQMDLQDHQEQQSRNSV